MSENKNLWIGLLLGMALTAGLMFVLYQQAAPLAELQQPIESATKRPAITPKIPEVSYSVKPDKPLPVARKKQPDEVLKPSDELETAAPAGLGKDNPAVSSDIGLPEGLDLSDEQLESMSKAERQEYNTMLEAYREVRGRVLRLHREREQLRQRMDKMSEQNETMEQKLGDMQEAVSQHKKENQVTQ